MQITDRPISRRSLLALAGAAAGGALLTACGGSNATTIPTPARQPAAPTSASAGTAVSGSASSGTPTAGTAAAQGALPTFVIQAVEYGFQTMGSVPGGPMLIQLKNLGIEEHQAQILRLNEGVSPAQLQQVLQTDMNAALQQTTAVGGPGSTAAKATSEVMLDLKEGRYAVACFLPNRQSTSHAALGMVAPLIVTAPPATAAALPVTGATVTMRDFAFALPAMVPAGRSMLRVTNEGAQPHELTIVHLAPGKTAQDAMQFLERPAGPPPFTLVGGMSATGPGLTGIAVLDLMPGDYTALCLVRDPASGQTHLHLGMFAGFTAR